MLIIYFVNWGGTLYRLYTRKAIGVPQKRKEEDKQVTEKKERMDRYFVRGSSNA
jgi:hypothetical protein